MITVDAVPGGFLAHGCCSLGPVHCMGLTEQMAIHKAKEKIRELMRAHSAQRLAEFQAKFPGFQVGAACKSS